MDKIEEFTIKINWFIPWTTGWLYTMGVVLATTDDIELILEWSIVAKITFLFISWFIWPLLLGFTV